MANEDHRAHSIENGHHILFNEVIWEFDSNMSITSVSTNSKSVLGYKPNELCNRSFYELLLPDSRRNLSKLISSNLSSKEEDHKIVEQEIQIIGSVKPYIWSEFLGSFIKKDGEIKIIGKTRPIEKRKELQKRLLLKDTVYRSIVEDSHVGVIIVNDNYKIVFCNKEMASMLEGSVELIQGKDFRSFLPKESEELVSSIYRLRMNGGTVPQQYEFKIKTIEGNFRDVNIISALKKDELGRHQIIAQILDVTDLKIVQKNYEKMDSTVQMYYIAMEASMVGMAILNDQNKYMYLNKAHVDIYGYDELDELLNKKWKILYGPEEISRFERHILPKLHERGFWNGEAIGRKKNGHQFLQKLSLNTLPNGGLVCIVRDIDEEKQKEIKLQESELKFRRIFQNSPVGIINVHKTGKILDVNPALITLLGSPSKEETMKINLFQFQPLVESGISYDFKQAFETGKKIIMSHPYTSKWGKKCHFRYHIIPIWNEEIQEYDSVISMVEDITDFMDAQNKLFESQKLDSIGTLAGGIAHDFNNMLSGILGYASLLKTELHDYHQFCLEVIHEFENGGDLSLLEENSDRIRCTGNEFKEYVNGIVNSTSAASDLTQKLLGIARKGKNLVSAVNLNRIVKDVVEIIERSINPKIMIHLNFNVDLHSIDADPSQMKQLAMNLILNAAEAMPQGGKITITTKNVSLDQDLAKKLPKVPQGCFVELSISDEGVGMDEETKKQIFDPFFTTKPEGKGLGLATVYGISKSHGGFVTVESKLGKGSKFNVFLPFGSKNTPKKSMSEKQSLAKGQGFVLIIEDETNVRKMVSRMIKTLGYDSCSAENGTKGIEVFKKLHKKIDLILLDMIMPDMTGNEVLAELLKINKGAQVILCTGYGKNEQAQKILDMGAKDLLSKPFSITNLSQVLKKFI